MSTGEDSIEGLSLTFPSTTRHHSGIYICQADNGGGQPATAEVRLDVQHAPVVEEDQVYVHDSAGSELDVTCTVHASPPAKVEWFKDSVVLTDEERVIRMEKRGNRHTLLLPSLGDGQDRSGVYKCLARNRLGEAEAEVVVSRHAAPVVFLSGEEGVSSDSYSLAWVTESSSPVTQFLVQHREEDGDQTWISATVLPVQESPGKFSGSLELAGLTAGTKYLAKIASRTADHELGSFSSLFVFATAEKKTEKPVEEEVIPLPTLIPVVVTEEEVIEPEEATEDEMITPEVDADVDISLAATEEYQVLQTDESEEMEANADAIDNADIIVVEQEPSSTEAIEETKSEDADAINDAVAIEDTITIDDADATDNKDLPDSIEDNMIESIEESQLIDDNDNSTTLQPSDKQLTKARESASGLVQDQGSLGAISYVNIVLFCLSFLVVGLH